MEAAVLPDYPDPQSYFPDDDQIFKLTSEQEEFIAAATAPKKEIRQKHHKRGTSACKRRRLDATVKFDFHAYIRTEADIDHLFVDTTNLVEDNARATNESLSPQDSTLHITPEHMQTPPAHLQFDGTLDVSAAKPCRWAIRPGYRKINTSGYKMGFKDWDAYNDALEAERLSPVTFRPHGGIASISAFGNAAKEFAIRLAKRPGLW